MVAAMAVPPLIRTSNNKELATGALKFGSTLTQAVQMWKQDINCYSDAKTCLEMQNLPDDNINNFDQIAKFMRVNKKIGTGANTEDWLPVNIYKYNGDVATSSNGNVSQFGVSSGAYLLQDGTTFSMDVDATGFAILVDVNGKKPPNRIGKDIFFFTVGSYAGKDVYYYPHWSNNTEGLCTMEAHTTNCDAENVNPNVGFGASPTAYVMSNQKLPDFKALSQVVSGFKQ